VKDKPAFPSSEDEWQDDGYGKGEGEYIRISTHGMSLLQYACIKLKVAKTGEKWLDDLIMESNHQDNSIKTADGILAAYKEREGE